MTFAEPAGGGINKVLVGLVGDVRSIIKPIHSAESARSVMTPSGPGTNGVARVKALLANAGLDCPPIPAELAPHFVKRREWCFSSKPLPLWPHEERGSSPYAYFPYVKAGIRKRVQNSVLVAHDGHGVNSYALHYYLVRKPLRLFLQLAWGGVYMDGPQATEEANRCFALVGRLVPSVEAAVRTGRLRATDRLVLAASEFWGCYWIKPGEEEKREIPGNNPRLALNTVLRWIEDPTNPWGDGASAAHE